MDRKRSTHDPEHRSTLSLIGLVEPKLYASMHVDRSARQAAKSCGWRLLVLLLFAMSANAQNSALNGTTHQNPDAAAVSALKTPEAPISGQGVPSDPNTYVIGAQDSLMITVWKEKEISGAVVVRPDGKITVPLVGEIAVVGLTPVQVQSMLAEKLKPFVTVPAVSVAVTGIVSRKVYLIGKVAREGMFNINSATTVLQLIAQAGGLKDFAKRKKIYILRQQLGGGQLYLPFNYDNAIRGKYPEQNILLQPGDTVVVP